MQKSAPSADPTATESYSYAVTDMHNLCQSDHVVIKVAKPLLGLSDGSASQYRRFVQFDSNTGYRKSTDEKPSFPFGKHPWHLGPVDPKQA